MDMALVSDVTLNAFVQTEWDGKPLQTKVVDKKKKDTHVVFNELLKTHEDPRIALDQLTLTSKSVLVIVDTQSKQLLIDPNIDVSSFSSHPHSRHQDQKLKT